MITYVKGDATQPQGEGRKIIAHICNNAGQWGAGFVMALSARDTEPERAYRLWSERTDTRYYMMPPFALGMIQLIGFEIFCRSNTWVCNMIAQDNVNNVSPPVSYVALAECLQKLNKQALFAGCSVHMPRIGCGIGGGHWSVVEALVSHYLTVPVTVYDF